MTDEIYPAVTAGTSKIGELGARGVSPSNRMRVVAWTAYGLLALIYLGALLSPVHGLARFLTLELIYTSPIALSVFLGGIAAGASAGVERRFWILLSAANATLVACEVLLVGWVLLISANGPPRVSLPFHTLHLLAALCFLGLIASMSRLQDETAGRLRVGLDITALGLLVYIVLLQGYARPVMGNAPSSAVLIGAAYPLMSFLMLFGTLANVVGFKFVKWRSWEMLVAVSLGVYAIAIAMWPAWYVTASDTSRNLTRGALDVVQLTGHYLLLMAAVYRLSEPVEWHLRPLPLPTAARNPWLAAVLPAGSLVAIASLLYSAFSHPEDSAWFTVYAFLALLLIAVMIARTVLLTMEHGTLFHRSVTDPLTGLFNHRYFHDKLKDEFQRAQRYGDELSVIVLDIDAFGDYNAAHGHLAGDLLLCELGEKLRGACPPPLVAARLGGDEFGVIAPEMGLSSAQLLAQRILDVIGIECGRSPGVLSASAGVACYPDNAESATELLRLADGALFHAKATGKARVVPYEDTRVPDLSAKERINRLEQQSRLSAVRALAAAVDARDPETQFHSRQVAALSAEVARGFGFDEPDVRLVELAGLLHDVGKIALPDTVLNKDAELDVAEMHAVQQHSLRGEDILRSTDLLEILPWVRGHHERWDGAGYPDSLSGTDISLEARIIAACDAYDVMVTGTSARRAMSADEAASALRAQAGSQFDPGVVKTLLERLAERSLTVAGVSKA